MVDERLRKYVAGYAHVEARPIELRGALELDVSGAVEVHVVRGAPAVAVGGPSAAGVSSVLVRREGDRLIVEAEDVPGVSGNGGSVVARGLDAIAIGGGKANVVIASGLGALAVGAIRHINGRSVTSGSPALTGWPGHVVVAIAIPELPEVAIAGSGNATLHDLEQQSLHLEIAGSGDIEAEGKVEQLEIDIAGSGDIDASRLIAGEVKVRIAGSGDATVHATDAANVRVQGSGDVQVRGNPSRRDTRVMGSGKVTFR